MTSRFFSRWWRLSLLAAIAACGNDAVGPSNSPPAHLEASTALTRSAAVGVTIPAGIVVKVTDASGRPVLGATVAFAVTQGNGSTNPRVAVTDSKGQATTAWTIGTVLGANEVTATVNGVTAPVKFQASGTPGPVASISLSPTTLRLLPTVDSTRLTALSLDALGNTASPAPTLVARDPTLISVNAAGVIRALRRGAGTYIVATAGEKTDSVLVTVLAAGQSICTAVADPIDLALGQVVTDISALGVCVHASASNAEYAIIPYFNTFQPGATTTIELRAQGLSPLSLPSATLFSIPGGQQPAPTPIPDLAFESRLRQTERAQGTSRIAGARAWFHARPPRGGRPASATTEAAAAAAAAQAAPAIGDILKLNVNATDYCDNADYRTGKIVAITNKAIIVADTANPAGGFTDGEYQSIGVTFDTLVDPVDRGAFGAPSDIDNNGHVMIFFTRAVNEGTSSGSSSVRLGFFYNRDLLPKVSSPTVKCDGSNVAEIVYILVPDPNGVINTNVRTKDYVVTAANGTVSHEYQHLINASRRLYVNGVGETFEERWLDEGLAHEAEELNFWRAAGLSPRANLDAALFTNPKATAAYSTFMLNNFQRYKSYLARPETQSPVGFDQFDDDLPTRGAIWDFLRFAADRFPADQENAFWFKLVNSNTSGLANLTNALGVAPNSLMRDWAISAFMDDNAPNVDPRFQEPSWNLRSAMTNGGTSLAFPLTTRLLNDNGQVSTILAGNGVSFYRFSVANGQDALITATSNGQPLPSTIQLAVVRVK
ncbi:MAG: hypothetical protein ABJF01_08710 [bacterium]